MLKYVINLKNKSTTDIQHPVSDMYFDDMHNASSYLMELVIKYNIPIDEIPTIITYSKHENDKPCKSSMIERNSLMSIVEFNAHSYDHKYNIIINNVLYPRYAVMYRNTHIGYIALSYKLNGKIMYKLFVEPEHKEEFLYLCNIHFNNEAF